MRIADVKRWQWLLIGIFIGGALGYAWLAWRQVQGFGGESIHPQSFEKLLSARDSAGKPALKRIVVHPHPERPGSYVVTAEHGSRKYWCDAITPYAMPSFDSASTTVVDRLDLARRQTPDLTYRFAWWELPLWTYAISTCVAIIVVGGIWPLLVNWLTFGTLRRPKVQPQFAFPPPSSQTGQVDKRTDTSDLTDVVAVADAIEAALSEENSVQASPAVATSDEQVTKPLSTAPLDASPPMEAPPDQKHFTASEDDYYPTERRQACHPETQ